MNGLGWNEDVRVEGLGQDAIHGFGWNYILTPGGTNVTERND